MTRSYGQTCHNTTGHLGPHTPSNLNFDSSNPPARSQLGNLIMMVSKEDDAYLRRLPPHQPVLQFLCFRLCFLQERTQAQLAAEFLFFIHAVGTPRHRRTLRVLLFAHYPMVCQGPKCNDFRAIHQKHFLHSSSIYLNNNELQIKKEFSHKCFLLYIFRYSLLDIIIKYVISNR